MSSHFESVDEHAGDVVVDLVGLFYLEEGLSLVDTPIPSDSTSQHEGAKEESEEEGED